MKSFFRICISLLGISLSLAGKPQIVILATGGTIAGIGTESVSAGYEAARTPVDEIIQAVPEIRTLADVTGEQFSQIASQDMHPELWVKLALRVNELLSDNGVDGVVITHGTDTMEETAYFLNLTIRSSKPVVLTGAMRPPTSLSADGGLNLYNAVAAAAAPESFDRGTLVVMNDEIHSARYVTKYNTTSVDAFVSPVFGPLGYVFYGDVEYIGESSKGKREIFKIYNETDLPRVDIHYSYAGYLPDQLNYAEQQTQGLVFIGTGNGNPNQETIAALAELRNHGIKIVRCGRPGTGRVTLNAEVNDAQYGFIAGDDVNPQKARILLMLALYQKLDQNQIQALFLKH